jgi:hypothetical protein
MYSLFSCDALSHSLQDSNASLKVNTIEEEGVEVCSLVRSISGLKRACQNFGMKAKMSDKWVNHSHELTQTKQQVN